MTDDDTHGSDDSPASVRADGGSASGADDVALDPWGSSTVGDYRKLFEEFGIEQFDAVLPEVPDPHYLMRRGVIFGHRDYGRVAEAMRSGAPRAPASSAEQSSADRSSGRSPREDGDAASEDTTSEDEPADAAVLSGFMPTGDPHIGHKMVFDEIIWHQERGADAFGLIADLEAHAARGLSWDEIDEHTRSYLLSLLALGFDPEDGELYRQSTNREVQDLAFELGTKANFSELSAIYDFDGETEVSYMQSVVTQMADILYPQLEKPRPTVIPVGPDQDPHMRLARDLAARMRFFKVTEAYASFEADDAARGQIARAYEALGGDEAAESDDPPRCEDGASWLREHGADAEATERAVELLAEAGKEPLRRRVRFFDRNATETAFEALIEAIDGEKRVFEGHIDTFDMDRAAAEDLAREVEVENGGYGFQPPSSVYHRFMTGLTGGKMSSSVPASHISLLDDPEEGYEKVKSATTGGRETAEEQREKGGKADECPVYELYAYLLAGDDDEFATEVYEECVGGERLCGDCKEQAAQLMEAFLEEHQEKREEAAEVLDDLDIELESPRKG